MATKSNNTKGNPYHDEEGKFTTKNGGGASSISVDKMDIDVSLISNFKAKKSQQLKEQANNPTFLLQNAKSLEEVAQIGDKILGRSGVCKFNNNTNLEVAKQSIMALEAVYKDFPLAMKGVIAFGTAYQEQVYSPLHVENQINGFLSSFFNGEESIMYDLLKKRGKDEQQIAEIKNNFVYINAQIQNIKLDSNTGGMTVMQYNPFSETSEEFNSMVTAVFLNKNKSQKINGFESPLKYESEEMRKLSVHKEKMLKGEVFDTSAHELGHAVSHFILPFLSFSEKYEYEKMTKIDKKLKKIQIPFPKESKYYGYAANTYEPAETDTSSMADAFRKGEVSRYALFSQQEAIAEAFADYYSNGDQCSEYNKKIVGYLKKIYNEKVAKING